MGHIVSAILARNEADRYLSRVINNAKKFCDIVLLLDDGSDDDTAKIAESMGCVVKRRVSDGWWGEDESTARAELWCEAVLLAGEGGWILVQDADMELLAEPEEIHHLCRTEVLTAWAWPLYDVWDDENTVRVDGLWGLSAKTPRVWLAKAPPTDFTPDWGRHGHHVGHCPSNLPLLVGTAPSGIGWKHLAYLTEENRKAKSESYLALAS